MDRTILVLDDREGVTADALGSLRALLVASVDEMVAAADRAAAAVVFVHSGPRIALGAFRQAAPQTPIIAVAGPEPLTRAAAWSLGAEAVLEGVTGPEHILAALLELLPPPRPERIELPDGFVDLVGRRVERGGVSERLTPREADLLGWLAARPERIVTTEELLVEVWGYKPSIKTRAIHNTMRRLRQKVERDPAEPALLLTEFGIGFVFRPLQGEVVAAPARPRLVRGRAPRPPDDALLGREAELEALNALVRGSRLVTVTGTGGVGKTRLVLELAATWAGHVLYADLSAAPRDAAFLPALADALSLQLGVSDPQTALQRQLGDLGPTLLIVDSVEHLAREAAPALAALVKNAPKVRLVASSRVSLQVRGERLFPLTGLHQADDAVALFLERARTVCPQLEPSVAQRRALAAALERLENLPLAIELAAARARTFDVDTICSRLAEGLEFLRARLRDRGERHGTLAATIAGSWRLLHPEQQRGLVAISVFAGSVGEEEIERVLAASGEQVDVQDLLEAGVEASLMSPVVGGTWRLLHPVRSFLRELDGEEGAVRERARVGHSSWYSRWGRLPVSIDLDRDRGSARRQLREELPEVEQALAAALEAGDWANLPALVAASASIRVRIGPIQPIVENLTAARARVRGIHRARTLAFLGFSGCGSLLRIGPVELEEDERAALAAHEPSLAAVIQLHRAGEAQGAGRSMEACHRYDDVIERGRTQGLPALICWASLQASHLHRHAMRFEEAEANIVRGLAEAQEADAIRLQAAALSQLGLLRWMMGEPLEGLAALGRSSRLADELQDRRTQAMVECNTGVILWALGRLDAAARATGAALRAYRKVGNTRQEARALVNLELIARSMGNRQQAEQLAYRAIAVADAAKVVDTGARARLNFAGSIVDGRPEEALRLVEEATKLLVGVDIVLLDMQATHLRLVALCWMGRPGAQESLRAELVAAGIANQWDLVLIDLTELGFIALEAGDLTEARRLLGEARGVVERHVQQLNPIEKGRVGRLETKLDSVSARTA